MLAERGSFWTGDITLLKHTVNLPELVTKQRWNENEGESLRPTLTGAFNCPSGPCTPTLVTLGVSRRQRAAFCTTRSKVSLPDAHADVKL